MTLNDSANVTIAGGWLGTYFYEGALANQLPTRFKATFTMSLDGRSGFSGTILDDGPLGAADATGSQVGRNVTFTKVYRSAPPSHLVAPITYEGILSEDGKLVTGTWVIPASRNRARRSTRLQNLVYGLWASVTPSSRDRANAFGIWEARRI